MTTDDINLIFMQAEYEDKSRRSKPSCHAANRELMELGNRKLAGEPSFEEMRNAKPRQNQKKRRTPVSKPKR